MNSDREWAYATFNSYPEQLASNGHDFRLNPPLIDGVYSDVVQDLPRTLDKWQHSKNDILRMKSVVLNWQTEYKWRNWNHASTQLMMFHGEGRSLDRSLLDYQLDLALSDKSPIYCDPIDGEGLLGRPTIWDYIYPTQAATWAVLYATIACTVLSPLLVPTTLYRSWLYVKISRCSLPSLLCQKISLLILISLLKLIIF